MWLMCYRSTIICGFRNWKDNPFVWIELRLAGICRSSEGGGNISANTCRMRDTWRLDFDNSDQDLQCNFNLSNNFCTVTVYVKDFACQSHCSYDHSFSYSHFHMITKRKNGFVFVIYHLCILQVFNQILHHLHSQVSFCLFNRWLSAFKIGLMRRFQLPSFFYFGFKFINWTL